jgi:ArsR family transcriptional regulator, arsenate/arsenite/antimonite-responsive transcriptional repressor
MTELVTIFKALSDETRLRIIKLLEQGELCVCDITTALDLIQPKVSFHLSTLKDAGFVSDRKDGKWIHYRFDDSDTFRRFLILSVLERIPADRIAKDKSRLGKWLEQKESNAAKACCPASEKRSRKEKNNRNADDRASLCSDDSKKNKKY